MCSAQGAKVRLNRLLGDLEQRRERGYGPARLLVSDRAQDRPPTLTGVRPERANLERERARAQEVADALGITLEIFVSPGGYIQGEETALLEALEDRRGEPRNKPPFPGIEGLFGLPTLINNVETLTMVTAIVARGARWWKEQGVNGCHGLKLLSVSGDVEAPGVYEGSESK